MNHISSYLPNTLEFKARMMTTCPVCGEPKSSGQTVCWGDCWRSTNGLKYTQLETEQWLKENAPKLLASKDLF